MIESTEVYFSFHSSYVCLHLTILLPLAHWSITSLSLSFSLPCPSYHSSGHSGTHDPVCGKRWESSGSTKGLAAINFAQATFTIIQRDSHLIALTLSPRQTCLPLHSPFSVNTKESSHFAFIRWVERKCWRESASLKSCIIFLSALSSPLTNFYFS